MAGGGWPARAILVCALVFACGPQRPAHATQPAAPLAVTVSASGSSVVQPGDALHLAVSRLQHSIAAGDVAVAFTRAGSSKPAATVLSSAVHDQGDGSYLITVTVPESLGPPQPAAFVVSLAGTDSSGARFISSNAAAIRIDPAAAIVSISQPSARAGQSVAVTIQGSFTGFTSGKTMASFGAGISVGGAAPGAAGPVEVINPNQALARLRIDGRSTQGTRDIVLTTGAHSVTASEIFSIEPTVKPLALAAGGPYTGRAGEPVSFDASGSTDPNGASLRLAWNYGDHGTGAGAKAQHTFAAPGTYAVTLTGTDALGAAASVNTTATISAAEHPLAVGHGGPYVGTAGHAVTFNATGSATGPGIAIGPSAGSSTGLNNSNAAAPNSNAAAANSNAAPVYTWNFGDGTLGSGASTRHAYASAGTFPVTLTVTNGKGATTTLTTKAIVTDASDSPVASAGGPYTGVAGQPLHFDGSDSGGSQLTYSWSFGDGDGGSGVRPVHTYAATGSYLVTLTVDDGRGGRNSSSTLVTIPDAKAPTANPGGPYKGIAGKAVDFNGANSTDPNGYALTYKWSFGDSTTGTGKAPTHIFAAAGNYTVELTVSDGHGGTASASTKATITAATQTLTADAGGPYTGIPQEIIQFNGTQSSGPAGKTISYQWNFGDKSTATGAQPTHEYKAAGDYTVTLTVSEGASKSVAQTTATIGTVIAVAITSPTPGTLTNKPEVSVSGTVAEATATVSVNGTPAPVSGGKWTAKSVALREGVNLITATATDKSGNTGSANVSVTLDTTPPSVSIVAPAGGSNVFSPQLTVSGLVSDLVAGTVNAQNVSVSVNGVAASVVNRSFSAPNILLSPGLNTIKVLATDKAGNTGEASVQVNYKTQITQQTVLLVSGDGQTGVINSTLAQPLVAQLVAANGQPVAGRPVTFTVTRSDGQVEVLPSQGASLSVVTDARGHASVLFKIGSRAGVGINQVAATSPGFMGRALFTATSTVDKPAFIHPVIGEHQRGIIGQRAPEPFQVIVSDRMGNPLENVPVTFTVTAGGGSIGGETRVTQQTNSDGKATVAITLGLQEGTNNNQVSANFTGNQGSPILFEASGLVPGKSSATTITGVVLDNGNVPVNGATVSLEGTKLRTTTNVQGQFTLSGVPVGTVTLLVDGSTSSSTNTYPSLSFVLQALPGVANSLDKPIYLPIIDTENAQTVGGSEPVTLTMTGVPGVAFTVQPNSVTFPDGAHVGKLSVSQVKADMVPMPPVNGVAAPLVWTIQPAGAKFNPPIQVQLPNVNGMPPGTVTEIYQYDHDLEQFVSAGTARVSPDGSVIVSDPGFGIVKAGWGHQYPPELPPGCTIDCNDHSVCLQGEFVLPCNCKQHAINIGGACGENGAPSNNCLTGGSCDQYGGCTGGKPKPGASCDDGNFCDDNDKCNAEGECEGEEFEDQETKYPEVSWSLSPAFEGFLELLNEGSPDKLELEASVSLQREVEESCCEEKMIKPSKRTRDEYKGTVGVTGKIYYPPATFSIPGTNGHFGPYLSSTIEVAVGFTNTTDECTTGCFEGGPFEVAGKAALGWDISDPTGTYKLNASGEVTIGNFQVQVSPDCKSAMIESSIGKGVIEVDWTIGSVKEKWLNITVMEGAPLYAATLPLSPAP